MAAKRTPPMNDCPLPLERTQNGVIGIWQGYAHLDKSFLAVFKRQKMLLA
jgi:hypothetical protein